MTCLTTSGYYRTHVGLYFGISSSRWEPYEATISLLFSCLERFTEMSALTLTTLPPEIRGSIFERALRSYDGEGLENIQGLGLLGASKQIHDETCLLPFQINTLSCPAITDSSTSATDQLLHRLSWQQRDAVRNLGLQVTGSTLDHSAAARLLKFLRLGNADGDVESGVAFLALPVYTGQLRNMKLTVSARDIAVPLADCSVGLRQTLDICCPMFAWIRSFPTLRNLSLHIRLRTEEQFPKLQREQFFEDLRASMETNVQIQTSFDIVKDEGYFVDELDLYRDSYLGIFGNVGPF